MNVIWFALNAAACAVNVAMFAANGNPVNLGAAAFSALFALWVLTWEAS